MKPLPALSAPALPDAPRRPVPRALAVFLLSQVVVALMAPRPTQAQSSCSSDGQRSPVALMERFIDADCAACWSAADTPRPQRGAVVLDWIVPGAKAEDASLSAAATRDASLRLQALGKEATQTASTITTRVRPAGALRLRVAQGPAVNGYVGASIELRGAGGLEGPVTAWLALVETIPPGVEGSPVQRNLVRNVLSPLWNGPEQLSKSKSQGWIESRPMGIPSGANPERLRVIGWVEDRQGRIRVMAQSHCASTDQRW